MDEQERHNQERLEDKIDLLTTAFHKFSLSMSQRVARVEVKSSIWGFLGGSSVVIIGLGIWIIKTT